MAAGLEVLLDRELTEDPSALHHLTDPGLDDLGRGEPTEILSVEGDPALGDPPAVDVEEPGHGSNHGGLTGPIGAQERDDGPFGDLEADPLEHENHVLVDNLEVLDGEHRVPLLPWRSSPTLGGRHRPDAPPSCQGLGPLRGEVPSGGLFSLTEWDLGPGIPPGVLARGLA